MQESEKQNKMFIISGPAGVGKTTLVKLLLKKNPFLKTSVTYTTRKKRKKTVEDKKIVYISRDNFLKRVKNNEFIEWSEVHNNYYGTHKLETEKVLSNYHVVFNIDVNGAKQLSKKFKKRVVSIFILPESWSQIKEHLLRRKYMSKSELIRRLKTAKYELNQKKFFNYRIKNYEGHLDKTVERIEKIIKKYI